MPQYPQNAIIVNSSTKPIPTTGLVTSGGSQGQAIADPTGAMVVAGGGVSGSYMSGSGGNMTTSGVLKTGPGRLHRIVVLSAGTSATLLQVNDAVAVGSATISNAIFAAAGNAANMSQGTVITLDAPFQKGLVVSTVPTGGAPVYGFIFD